MATGLKETAVCIGYAQYTSTGSAFKLATAPATGLTIPPTDGALPNYCIVQAEAQNLRWRDDGVAPTASVGMILYAGQMFGYDGNLNKIQFIQTISGAILNVAYYA